MDVHQLLLTAFCFKFVIAQVPLELEPLISMAVLPRDGNAFLTNNSLEHSAFLICLITPANLAGEEYETRWTVPTGETFDYPLDGPPRYIYEVSIEDPSAVDGQRRSVVVLNMAGISYEDDGEYVCEIRRVGTEEWVAATITLKTIATVVANESEVLSNENATDVVLSCEMRDYIRPDEQFQWYSDGERINDTDRYEISYTNGTPNAAQLNGLSDFVPARVITLTIFDPLPSDSGTYTCRVQGTAQFSDIALTVLGAQEQFTNTDEATVTIQEQPKAGLTPASVAGIAVGGAGAAIMLVLGAIVCTLCTARSKAKKHHPTENDQMQDTYDYIDSIDSTGYYCSTEHESSVAAATATTSKAPTTFPNEAYGSAAPSDTPNETHGPRTNINIAYHTHTREENTHESNDKVKSEQAPITLPNVSYVSHNDPILSTNVAYNTHARAPDKHGFNGPDMVLNVSYVTHD